MTEEIMEGLIEAPANEHQIKPFNQFFGIEPATRIIPPKAIFYGRNGIGKSDMASHAPKAIFMDLDKNTNELKCVRNDDVGYPIINYIDVLRFLDALIDNPHPFRTLVVDSITVLNNIINACIQEELGQNKDFKYSQYSAIAPKWDLILQKLQKLWEGIPPRGQEGDPNYFPGKKPMIIILIGHIRSEPKPSSNPLGDDILQYELSIDKRACLSVQSWCSTILFFADAPPLVNTETKEFGKTVNKVKTNSLHRRVIHTDWGGAFIAKNTYNLPKQIEFRSGKEGWNIFFNQFRTFHGLPIITEEDE